LSPGDELKVRPKSTKTDYFKRIDDTSPVAESSVSWVKVSRAELTIKVVESPTREEVEPGINEQLIVEYYSR